VPATKAASRASGRGAAGRSATNGKVATVTFRGLKLEIPSIAPGEVLFDLDNNDVLGTLRTIVGERQFGEIRQKVAGAKLEMSVAADQLTKLVREDIFQKVYGISLGE
jgi:hypothetical protein